MPETFDLRGILSLVLQILGLTYSQIRPQLVEQLGEPLVAHLETALEVVRILLTEGISGIWSRITEFLTVSLPEMVIGVIRNVVLERIRSPIRAALGRVIGWIVGQARRLGNVLSWGGHPENNPETPQSKEVRNETQRRLQQRLPASDDRDDILRIVRSVETEMIPRGLASLRIQDKPGGGAAIVAVASPPRDLFNHTLPAGEETGSAAQRSVRIAVTVTFSHYRGEPQRSPQPEPEQPDLPQGDETAVPTKNTGRSLPRTGRRTWRSISGRIASHMVLGEMKGSTCKWETQEVARP